MLPATNQVFRLARRPVGLPTRDDWTFAEEPVTAPGPGQFLVEVLYISLDPAMRGWMNDMRSYLPPVAIGEVMRALGVGRVIASNHSDFAVGASVTGTFGVQRFALSDGRGVRAVDPSLAPLPMHVGILGITGLTAYFGLLDVGRPRPGDTVVVSAAAGAVGSAVGQIARLKQCRAVGIAGGADKCRALVEEFGFDAAIDYKAGDLRKALREHCPKGIDVYFDNVGGDILEAALANIARGARIVISGAISQYNNTAPMTGPSNYMQLLVQRASMAGFLVFDYADRYGEAIRELGGWLASGQLRSRDQIVEGFTAFPETFLMLFRGDNTGKLVLKV